MQILRKRRAYYRPTQATNLPFTLLVPLEDTLRFSAIKAELALLQTILHFPDLTNLCAAPTTLRLCTATDDVNSRLTALGAPYVVN